MRNQAFRIIRLVFAPLLLGFVFPVAQAQEVPVLEWAVGTSESTNTVTTKSFVTDAAGNSFLCGYFIGTADFNPGLPVFNVTSAGQRDIFIVKLDANGNFVWAKTIGGTLEDEPSGVDVDGSGNIYINGF